MFTLTIVATIRTPGSSRRGGQRIADSAAHLADHVQVSRPRPEVAFRAGLMTKPARGTTALRFAFLGRGGEESSIAASRHGHARMHGVLIYTHEEESHMRMTFTALFAIGLLCASEASAQRRGKLAAPVRIEVDGAPIDTGKDIGHAGPIMRDYDADGLPDLLVSSFRGNIRFFKNVGTRSEPKFKEGDPLEAAGEPIRIHNW